MLWLYASIFVSFTTDFRLGLFCRSYTIVSMQQARHVMYMTRIIAFIVLIYGLTIIAGSLLHETRLHNGRDIDALTISLPLLSGVSYVYLGSLLLRRKYNAWLTAVALSIVTLTYNLVQILHHPQLEYSDRHVALPLLRVLLPLFILALLLLNKKEFRVRSDFINFRQALQISVVLLFITFLYGVGGFMLLSERDLHTQLSLQGAVHQTIDQFGLTTTLVVPHTQRARLFLDSLSVISIAAIVYAIISFFQPLRMRLTNQAQQRNRAEELLTKFPSDIDDFFKLWPHDKHYFFDKTGQAGLAYHVTRGVALVVGDPIGSPKQFRALIDAFSELCFVNDWLVSFIHIGATHVKLYKKAGFRLQKIGEEAIVDLHEFESERNNKYFRHIRNRFQKLDYSAEILQPPHSAETLRRLKTISDEWLARPGRAERRLLLGYYDQAYLQQTSLVVVYDAKKTIQGFMNLVPTYVPGTANYDLLRCSNAAPGNCNDFLVLSLIELLQAKGVQTLNLGLCPLSGLDEQIADATLIDTALRFFYANGDKVYSFSGLHRFKAKYKPTWENRYIAYSGGVRTFTRIVAALGRAMKV